MARRRTARVGMAPPARFRGFSEVGTRDMWPVPREQVIPARDMILPIGPDDVLRRRSVPGYPAPVETLPIGPPAQQRITPEPVETLPIGPPAQRRYTDGYYRRYRDWLRAQQGYRYPGYTPPWQRGYMGRPQWVPWQYWRRWF